MKLDHEDLQTYQQRNFFENARPSSPDGITIFFAVLGAILTAWLIREAYMEWQVRRALHAFNEQIEISAQQTQKQLEQIRINNEAARLQAQQNVRLQAEEQARLTRQQLQQQNEIREKTAALEIEKSRKEKAWKQYYRPVSGCEMDNPDRETVKCGNDFIKARRLFDAQWPAQVQGSIP